MKQCRRSKRIRLADSSDQSTAPDALGPRARLQLRSASRAASSRQQQNARKLPTRNHQKSPKPSPAEHQQSQAMAKAPAAASNQMDLIKAASRLHLWHWNEADKSHECVVGADKLEVCFHPQCSENSAAIRGSEPLVRNGNYYYWEVTVFDKAYGTSVMFGLCTKQQSLHANDYCNLVGLDANGWSLSHKGLIWHDGNTSRYTKMFPINQTITIGLLFDTMRGELSYFMDGVNLGVAFSGLNDVNSELYPVIGSTAKCTRMRLTGAYCGYVSLLERSCFTILNSSKDKEKLFKTLQDYKIPRNLINYLAECSQVCNSRNGNNNPNDQCNWNVLQMNGHV